ncbi:MAG: hypothetical protein WC723_04825 [Candidatus Omnitrophota bacterium]
MKVEKEKHKVCITCIDGSLVNGFVYINPGERITDFLNDQKKNFIAITESDKKANAVIVNKSSIRSVEEV